MVAAAHPLAVEAGLEVLRRGGSAVDAAIAVQMVLGVVEPQASGIGGGGFLLHYDGATRRASTVYDGRETAPAGATPTMFLDRDGKPLGILRRRRSRASRSACRARVAHAGAGAQGARQACLEPSCSSRRSTVAREGFAVPPRLAGWLQRMPLCATSPTSARSTSTPTARPKKLGERVTNPALAETMQLIADAGRARASTKAPSRAEMVERVRSHVRPGTLSLADLADYRPIKREPVCGPYRVWIVCGMPPPSSGGIAILQVLGLLEPFELWRDKPDDLRALHLIAEASRLAFADRDRYVADPAFVPVPVAGLLSPAYIAERRKLISRRPQHGRGRPRPAARLCRARHQPYQHRRSLGQRGRLHHHHRGAVRRADHGARLSSEQRADRFLAAARGRRQAGRQPGRARQAAALVDVAHPRSSTATASFCRRWARPAGRASSATRCRP